MTGVQTCALPILLYLRGKFTLSDVKLVSEALVLYSPTMVAYGVRDVLNRAFYSAKDTRTPMIYSIVGVVINIVLSAALYKYMLVPGLTLSSSISSVVITLMLFLKMNKKFPGLQFLSMTKTLGKIAIASTIMGVVIYFIKEMFIVNLATAFVLNLTSLFVCAVVGLILYFVLTYLFKIEETMYVWNIFKSKISKK